MTRSTFYCIQCEEDDCTVSKEHLSVCKDAIYCWKSTTLRANDGRERYARGCIFNQLYSELFCNNSTQINSHYRADCCKKNFCNGGVFPIFEDPKNGPGTTNPYVFLTIFAPLIGVVLVAFIIAMYYHLQAAYFSSKSSTKGQHEQHEMTIRTGLGDAASNEVYEEVYEYVDRRSPASGTVSRTKLSNEISLDEKWTTGNFSPNHPELWSGTLNRKKVIVKIYSLSWEETWIHETDIYTNLLTNKHDNILQYVDKDTTPGKALKQFWLVTRLPLNGPLVNYLQETRLDKKAMLKACSSLSRGLSYLHSKVPSKRGKLGMAHRNLGSHNVFVNRDGSCVIGGFECAVTEELLYHGNFFEIAAKRYMSPEYLYLDIEEKVWYLDCFQQADVYSLSLIFWEICRMCIENNDGPKNYVAAYSKWLFNGSRFEPTIEDMRRVIVYGNVRPEIPNHWHTDLVMDEMGSIIRACWDTDSKTRWSSLRIKKTLAKLAKT